MTTATVPAETIRAAGVDTTVRRKGSGRSVLYMHSAFFPTEWTDLHDELADRFDLIAPIHPGYAEGGPPDWMHGFDDLVLHYRALLDELELDRVDLVGYGLGAWIGANLAAFHPERVRSFCAIAPMGLWVPDAPMFEFIACDPARRITALFNGEPAGYEHLFADPDDISEFVKGYGEDGVTARLIWERRYDTRLERRLEGLSPPAIVIAAEDDRVVPAAHTQRWAELLGTDAPVTIAGTGHGLVVQAPDRVSDSIASFLEGVPA